MFEARLTNLIANLLALVAVVALLVGGGYWFIHRPVFNIAHISIEPKSGNALNYVSPASVQSAVGGRLNGNFFTINLDEAKTMFETAPWVRKADIVRVWPNSLLVKIEEQEPFAYWGDNQLINTWGEVFTANQAELPDDAKLPQFNGPDGSERLVIQRHAELVRWLAPLKLTVKEITLSPRYAWKIELSDNIELIMGRDPGADTIDPSGEGRSSLSFAATIERFVNSWPQLQKQLNGQAVKRVDLRYSNGFAIALAQVNNPQTVSKEKK